MIIYHCMNPILKKTRPPRERKERVEGPPTLPTMQADRSEAPCLKELSSQKFEKNLCDSRLRKAKNINLNSSSSEGLPENCLDPLSVSNSLKSELAGQDVFALGRQSSVLSGQAGEWVPLGRVEPGEVLCSPDQPDENQSQNIVEIPDITEREIGNAVLPCVESPPFQESSNAGVRKQHDYRNCWKNFYNTFLLFLKKDKASYEPVMASRDLGDKEEFVMKMRKDLKKKGQPNCLKAMEERLQYMGRREVRDLARFFYERHYGQIIESSKSIRDKECYRSFFKHLSDTLFLADE